VETDSDNPQHEEECNNLHQGEEGDEPNADSKKED
jgi:hypothetical protein